MCLALSLQVNDEAICAILYKCGHKNEKLDHVIQYYILFCICYVKSFNMLMLVSIVMCFCPEILGANSWNNLNRYLKLNRTVYWLF